MFGPHTTSSSNFKRPYSPLCQPGSTSRAKIRSGLGHDLLEFESEKRLLRENMHLLLTQHSFPIPPPTGSNGQQTCSPGFALLCSSSTSVLHRATKPTRYC